MNDAVATKGWQQIAEIIHEIDWIDSVDPASQRFVAFLPDEDGDPGSSVTLDSSKTVHQNAQRYLKRQEFRRARPKGP